MALPVPPILRRAPPVVPLLLFALATLLLLVGHPTTRQHVVPQSWVGGSGLGGPVGIGAGDDGPLPKEYEEWFPSGQLPRELESEPRLARALTSFLRRPALSHEEASNGDHCPEHLARLLVNPDQLKNDGPFWRELSPADIRRKRAELVQYLAARKKDGNALVFSDGEDGGESTGTGRGIVLTAGNKDTTARAITLLRMLKHYGNTLPIEVFHYEDELRDDGQRRTLEELGAKVVQVRNAEKKEGRWKNWQIKSGAIIESSFREVLSLDSDNIPLGRVEHLFDADLYKRKGGAVFWPDITKDHPDNAIWRIVGDHCSFDEWSFESGEIVIDKGGNGGLNLAALWLATGMMADDTFWFKLCGGDKDTFRWAFRALDIKYARPQRWLSALGYLQNSGSFCGHTMLQYDITNPKGQSNYPPLFVHSNLLKHLGQEKERPIFRLIKKMKQDRADDPTLNHVLFDVKLSPWMCTDLTLHTGVKPEEIGENFIELQDISQVEGNPFDGFEKMFFESGGLIGGW